MPLKQTHLYKVKFKPGSFAPIGERNKIGDLYLERAIGDWLVAKGIAETEDNCRYNLNCCGSDTTLSYNDGNLCITVDDVQQCVTLEIPFENVVTTTTITIDGVDYPPGTTLTEIIAQLINYINNLVVGTTITTDNGLSGTGSLLNPAVLGGTLIQNTTVDGDSSYTMSFTNLTQFLATVIGASAGGTLRVGGAASLPSFLSHYKVSDPTVYARSYLDFNDTFGLEYNDANGTIGFRIFPDETDVSNLLGLRTKGIRDGTRTNGMIPVLTDDVEGTFEWDNVPGASVEFEDFEDDTAAGAGGIAIGQCYSVTSGNPYGLADGTIKKRRS